VVAEAAQLLHELGRRLAGLAPKPERVRRHRNSAQVLALDLADVKFFDVGEALARRVVELEPDGGVGEARLMLLSM